jgi:ArsR family transcriptional regulator, arsenate/arsenite/antimonite-responsive transcriptional repressor
MSYVYVIRNKPMNKSEKFDDSLQTLARFTKVLSHPARLAILKYLAEAQKCISGDISDFIPLGRTTVSQHLKELKEAGLITGEIDGLKVSYCLCDSQIKEYIELLNKFFREIGKPDIKFC